MTTKLFSIVVQLFLVVQIPTYSNKRIFRWKKTGTFAVFFIDNKKNVIRNFYCYLPLYVTLPRNSLFKFIKSKVQHTNNVKRFIF